MAEWACPICGATTGRLRRAALCEACRASEAAQGRAWCGGCDSSQPILGRDKRRARCAECERARERSRKRSRAKKRPAVALPPLSPITQQLVRAWVALVDEAWVGSFD